MGTSEKVGLAMAGLVLLGLVALFVGVDTGPEVVIPPSTSGPPAGAAQVAFISRGDAVDLDAHLPGSGRTVIEFTAEW
jgi:hypothetical protein